MSSPAYAVTVTRHFYAPEPDRTTLLFASPELAGAIGDGIATFVSLGEAREWIDARDGEVIHLGHNEYSARTYHAVGIGSQRFRRAFRATFGGAEWCG